MAVSSRIMIQQFGKVSVVDFIDAALMDAQQIQQIGSELISLVDDHDKRHVLLDFSGIKFLSSQMLGVMLNVHKKISDRKGWLGICGLKKDLHKVFKLTKLDKVFNFYSDQDEALRAVEI